ncbi:STAS domain-containing protein [Rhizobium sp. P38BS-XIX]|uniref:STAS domain-containing protein n=1 Tax=Rhizobium sp. P38BS-XIX TaxID=2726740 RepID=UPI001456301C|nr:STAS domain-containing protein [Rhizobium sp. P38BS-XIX]NLR98240.1 STAS domain-containing protein [Rhizobium sp. P38BS-XIX]
MSAQAEILQLHGPLTIKTIANVRDILQVYLQEAASLSRSLVIDVDGNEDIDLTLPQLLLSAQQTANQAGIHIALNKPADGNFLAVLQRAGLLSGDRHKDSFWLEGKAA